MHFFCDFLKINYLFNVFFPPLQIKETGEVAIAGGYVDIVPALEKPSAGKLVMVSGSNGSLSLQRSIVRLYLILRKTQEKFLGLLPILFAVFRGNMSSEMLTCALFKIQMLIDLFERKIVFLRYTGWLMFDVLDAN